MIISEKTKLLFIHNQKAAGMSIEHILLNSFDGIKLLERHSYAEDGIEYMGREKWNEFMSFGFVRNPWSRLVSWYTMIQETPPEGKNALWEYVHQNSNSFEEFVINCTETITDVRNSYAYRKSFVRPQYDYFTDNKGELAVAFIGRFENLQDDFNTMLDKAGLASVSLPKLNPTRSKDYKSFYTNQTKDIVAQRFAKDIEKFNYTFE